MFNFMSCLDISEWKAFETKPTVSEIIMIDVIIVISTLNV